MDLQTTRFAKYLPFNVVAEHIQRDGVAILTSGSFECHGPHMPLGTDTIIVEAVAQEVARACDGLIFPAFHYTYSGGTAALPGTITMPGEAQRAYVRAVIMRLIRNGYRRIMHLQWHAPYYVHQQSTREIFEETGVPVAFFGLLEMPLMRSPEIARLIGTDGADWEAALVAAALKLLGQPGLQLHKFTADTDRKPREEDAWLGKIGAAGGTVGHFYTDPSQHQPVRIAVDAEAGVQVIALMARAVAATAEPLQKYVNQQLSKRGETRHG